MANTFSSSYTLKLELLFSDEDTRTITLENPRENLTREVIDSYSDYLLEHPIFIGDKTKAAFTGIGSANLVTVHTEKFDLS